MVSCRNYFKALLLVFVPALVFSQEIALDTVVLVGVNVLSSRIEDYGTANKVVSIKDDLIPLANQTDLSEVLANYSGLNIRSYGLSGLATASFRGSGSSQTAVMWEGINLQSPTNGSVDLTQVPISFIDKVQLQYGAGSSFSGSGAVGGAIILESEPASLARKSFGVGLHQQFGSFGKSYTGLNLYSSKQKLSVNIRSFYHAAENDYTYFNRFSNEKEQMKNAAIEQKGLLIEPALIVGENSLLEAKYWYQENRVEIPKTAGQNLTSDNVQKDNFHRAVVSFQKKSENLKIKAFTGLLHHELVYNQTNPSISNVWVSEINIDQKIDNHTQIQFGVNNRYETAEVSNYGGKQPTRNQTAVFLMAKKLFFDQLELAFSAREVISDGALTPFVPALEANYQLNSWYALKAKAARSYRLPTFNDLYWVGAIDSGNPNLKPEEGLNFELGNVIGLSKNLNAEFTFFSNQIDNWIQWQPGERGWSPVNVMQAWLRGAEAFVQLDKKLNDHFSLQSRLHYSYTKATKEKINERGNSSEIGNQLIYVPKHQGSAFLTLGYKDFAFSLNQIYTGKQFTTGDNKDRWALDAYFLTDITFSFQQKWNNHMAQMSFRVNNAFDKDFEVRYGYPMPGRHFNLSIKYNLN